MAGQGILEVPGSTLDCGVQIIAATGSWCTDARDLGPCFETKATLLFIKSFKVYYTGYTWCLLAEICSICGVTSRFFLVR